MKITVVASTILSVALSIGSTSAFVHRSGSVAISRSPSHLSNSNNNNNNDDDQTVVATSRAVDGTVKNVKYVQMKQQQPLQQPQMTFPIKSAKEIPKKSVSIPFMNRPQNLDGTTLAGDVGFDPIGFANSDATLMNYREAEIKHARLAMLAAAGWPLSELWDTTIAHWVGMDPVLDEFGRVPSVLNGGMGRISPVYWIGCIVVAAAFDIYGSYFNPLKKNGAILEDASYYIPGDFGWRGFYPTDPNKQEAMRLSEIKHGRLAMLAITGFALQEFVTDIAVIDQTPIFFKPITEFFFQEAVVTTTTASTPDVITEVSAAAAAATLPSAVMESVASSSTAAITTMTEAPVESSAVAAAAASSLSSSSVDVVTDAGASAAAAVVESVQSAASALTSTPLPSVGDATVAAAATDSPSPTVAAAVVNTINASDDAIVAELSAAKQQIVALESKLAEISALTR